MTTAIIEGKLDAVSYQEKLGIKHPVLLAPMGFGSGGALAKAVTKAGGLGLIGLRYGDQDWLDQEFL
jgi:nitronate monooxygenase